MRITKWLAGNDVCIGLKFHCPGCGSDHHLYVASVGTPPPGPRWDFNGDYALPTLVPSIKAESADEHGKTICHTYVRSGRIQFLSDCTHSLRGQTVDLPEIQEDKAA